MQFELINGLILLTDRMPSAQATDFCIQIAKQLANSFGSVNDPLQLSWLGRSLLAIASRLTPADAARFCKPAAQPLSTALFVDMHHSPRRDLANSLSGVAAGLSPAEAEHILFATASEEWRYVDKDEHIIWGHMSGSDGIIVGLLIRSQDNRRGKRVALGTSVIQLLGGPTSILCQVFSADLHLIWMPSSPCSLLLHNRRFANEPSPNPPALVFPPPACCLP